MHLDAFDQVVSGCMVFELEGSDRVMEPHHHIEALLALFLEIEVTDVLEVEKQSPLIHLTAFAVPLPLHRPLSIDGKTMGRHCHAALQLHQLRLRNHQHVAEITQARGIIRLVVQRSEGELNLPLSQVLKELGDKLIC